MIFLKCKIIHTLQEIRRFTIMKKLICFFLISVFLMGCSKSREGSSAANESVNASNEVRNADIDIRKLVKEADVRFLTTDNRNTYQLVNSCLKGFGAYISDENTFNNRSQSGYELTIRVPATHFDSLLNFILTHAPVKELESKRTSVNDVTDEFIDTEARIKIKKESAQKLADLMKQSKNLTEILEIQKQLTDLQSEIESVEGRLKYLDDRVIYSTIRITFYERVSYSERFAGEFRDSLKGGWQVFLFLLTGVAYLWIVIIVVLMVWLGIRYYKRSIKRKNQI